MTKTSESIPQIFSKEIIVDSENNTLTIRGDGISGSGAGLYNLTSSNISNFTNDVRNQFSPGTNITIVSGVISSVAETVLNASGIDKSIQFNSGSIISGSSNLVYDYINNRLGIGTSNPQTSLDVSGVISINGKPIINTINNENDIYANIRVLSNDSTTLNDGMYINYNSTGGPSANLRFYANATNERMRINASDGNVGIGTAGPEKRLDVNGSSNDFAASIASTNLSIGAWSGLHFGYREDNNFYRKSAIVFERLDADARGKIHLLNNITADSSNATLADARLTINQSGNVGIATTSPNFTLAVTGTLGVSGNTTLTTISGTTAQFTTISGSIVTGSFARFTQITGSLTGSFARFTQITGSHSGSGAGLFGIPNGGLINSAVTVGTTSISLGSSATTIQGITVLTGSTVTGSTALFTQITAAHVSPTGSLSTPSYSFVNDPNTGIYSPGADTLAFVEGGVEVIRIDSNSRVGIGKTATIDKLEVNGNVTITGTLRISSDLEVNGGDITSTSTTFNLLNTNVSTLNIGAEATSVIFSDSTTTGSILRLNSVGAPSNLSSPQINIYNYTSSINNNVDLGMYNILADNGVGSLSTRGGMRVRYDGAAGAGKIAFVIGSAGGGVGTYTTVNTGGLSVDIGDIKINNGDLIFNTAGSGINFSSTTDGITSSNEILDDYEEGTWLPAISGTVTAGNYTYDRNGYYTKVGNLVYINMYMAVSTFTTPASGNIRITGLPFVNSSFRSSAFTVTDFRGTTTQFRLSGSSGNSATSTSYISLWKALNANTLVSSSDFSPQTGENVLISLLGFYRTSS